MTTTAAMNHNFVSLVPFEQINTASKHVWTKYEVSHAFISNFAVLRSYIDAFDKSTQITCDTHLNLGSGVVGNGIIHSSKALVVDYCIIEISI